jgi:transformation/transcription domain-associated protein
VRTDLSLIQISRVIHLYARNIHDTTLPFAIQTMSAKLLLNLVECIARKNDPEGKGRALLVRILDTFVNKFASLKNQIPKLLQNKQGKSFKATDNIKDCRLLLKTLVLGLKNIVWGIGSCTPSFKSVGSVTSGVSTSNQPSSSLKTSTLEESLIFTSLQKNALKCFVIYSQSAGWPVPYPQEEKDVRFNVLICIYNISFRF